MKNRIEKMKKYFSSLSDEELLAQYDLINDKTGKEKKIEEYFIEKKISA